MGHEMYVLSIRYRHNHRPFWLMRGGNGVWVLDGRLAGLAVDG